MDHVSSMPAHLILCLMWLRCPHLSTHSNLAGGNKYSGPMAAAADILRTDGPRGFFKGWVANFSRLGPQTVLTFLANEALRSAMGMKAI